MQTVNQPTSAPSDKLTAATIGTGLATVLYSIAARKWPVLADQQVMSAAIPALAMAFTFGPGYIKREASEAIKLMDGNRRWWIVGAGVAVVAAAGAVGAVFF